MTSAEDGTLQAARRLVWVLVVPVLLLLAVLSLLQYQQRMVDAKRDLLRRADARAQELEALARPAMHHVHDLVRLLQIHWDAPPDAGSALALGMSPAMAAQAIDGWSLDAAAPALRQRLGQVWWAPPDRRPPETLWLRRAQVFVEVARVAQERAPGFESTWFVASDVNVSFGYPWVSSADMLLAMGLPSLRAMEGLRMAGVLRALRRRAEGRIVQPHWGEPYVGQLNGELVQSHVAEVWRADVYLGEVSVDVRLDALQRQAQRWQAEGNLVWVASNGGFVMADTGSPLAAPARMGMADTPMHVPLASRLPPTVTAGDMQALLARTGADGGADLQEAAGWALVAAQRKGSPWVYVEATPLRELRNAVLPTLLPNALLGLALLLVFVASQWLISRWFVTPAVAVLAYMRQLSVDPAVPAPALGPRWRGWVNAITETFADQRALQQRERAHEAFKSAMVDNAPMAIVTQDESGCVVEFNPAAERLLGLSRAQAVGQPLPAQLLPATVLQHAAIDGSVLDITGQRSDGSSFAAQVQRFALPQDSGNFQIAFITDQTARLAAAQQIENQREALRQSEKLNAMGNLLAGVAHELNNPLSVVMGRASLLQDKLERRADGAVEHAHEATREAARDDARRVRLAAERCGRIVRTFLNMARQRPPQRRAVQLGDVVHAAADMLGYSMRGQGIEVALELAEPLPDVQADPDQLGQVVLNLMVNAQQALAAAATRAHLGRAPRIVLSSGLEPARAGRPTRVWLRVADNGPGVPASAREQIFQPFFTTKADGLGTGLGLSVSLAIVHEHGGSLVLEETAAGACFRLSLPSSGHGEHGPLPVPAVAAEEPANSGRVLVVDDEPELADLMRAMLEGAGLEVATAESGAVALELLRVARFDAVVSDLRMPDMDGQALWQAVCALDAALSRRMLFVSGDTLSSASQQWLQAQGLSSLDKPFSSDELLAAVRRLLV